MLQTANRKIRNQENGRFSTAEDFERLFEEHATDLLRLALHLTADAEKAEGCLILAMRDCSVSTGIAKDRAYIWARRMVIRNAVRMIWGTPTDFLTEPAFEIQVQPTEYPPELIRESFAILALSDFERLAFVICILERYSFLDCALLLVKTPQEVHEAVLSAADQVVFVETRSSCDDVSTASCNKDGALGTRGMYLDGSCGSLFGQECQ